MTSNALAKHLFLTYERNRLSHLTPGNCKHDRIIAELFELILKSKKLMAMEELGSSSEARPI